MLLILVVALFAGCASMKKKNIAWELDEYSRNYNKMLRWHELENASAIFPPVERQEEFSKRVRAAKNVTITDFRIKKKECLPEKGEATVILDIDYYREPSVTVKTVEDKQIWKYVGENDKKRWRLMTLPPDFP
jgi:uncharacterized protein YceK